MFADIKSDHLYILVINGRPEGPFTIDELRAKAIKPGDFVKTDGMEDYKEAHEVAELRQLFGFSKQAFLQYFGSFDQRLMATAVDWFIVSGGFIILAFIALFSTDEQSSRFVIVGGILAMIPLARLAYNVVMESSDKQGTYGKQLVKIRVADLQGDRITPSKALSRNLAKFVSALPLFLGYLMAFFNKQQQCLHDIIAGTVVIKDRID